VPNFTFTGADMWEYSPQTVKISLVQEHMHTLKTVQISLCRDTYFETVNFYRRSTDLFMLVFNGHFRFVFLFNLHYTNLLMIMTKAHNISQSVSQWNA